MKNYIFKYGLLSGLLIGLVMSIIMVVTMGAEAGSSRFSEVAGYIIMLLGLSLIIVGTKRYRDYELGGLISFGKAFKVGILITLIASLIYAIWWMIFYAAGPGQQMMTEYTEAAREGIRQSALAQEEIQKQLDNIEKWTEMYKNPFVRFGITLMEIIPVGLVVTIVSALILKKK